MLLISIEIPQFFLDSHHVNTLSLARVDHLKITYTLELRVILEEHFLHLGLRALLAKARFFTSPVAHGVGAYLWFLYC